MPKCDISVTDKKAAMQADDKSRRIADFVN